MFFKVYFSFHFISFKVEWNNLEQLKKNIFADTCLYQMKIEDLSDSDQSVIFRHFYLQCFHNVVNINKTHFLMPDEKNNNIQTHIQKSFSRRKKIDININVKQTTFLEKITLSCKMTSLHVLLWHFYQSKVNCLSLFDIHVYL